jgi:tetratricopeptide (TPR) repeat protein
VPHLRAAPLVALGLLLCASAADAQRERATPRPRLPAAADSNSATAYYDLGVSLLARRAADAAGAFEWAARLEPRSAEALYAWHAALLIADPRLNLEYHGMGRPGARASREAVGVDSLYLRALMLDPFVHRRFERDVLQALVASIITGGRPEQVPDQTVLLYYTGTAMTSLPPHVRARMHAAEGRLVEAMRDFDAVLRSTRRGGERRESRRWVHQERARVYARAGNDSAALEAFDAAMQTVQEEERDVLVRVYTSRALLEHARGLLHEQRGDLPAAREAYGRALVEDLSYHPAHARLAALLVTAGDTAGARAAFELAVAVAPADPVLRLVYGAHLAATGDAEAAERELAAATARAPEYAEPWILLATVREQRGDVPGALEAFRAFRRRARADDRRLAQVDAILAVHAAPASPSTTAEP